MGFEFTESCGRFEIWTLECLNLRVWRRAPEHHEEGPAHPPAARTCWVSGLVEFAFTAECRVSPALEGESPGGIPHPFAHSHIYTQHRERAMVVFISMRALLCQYKYIINTHEEQLSAPFLRLFVARRRRRSSVCASRVDHQVCSVALDAGKWNPKSKSGASGFVLRWTRRVM